MDVNAVFSSVKEKKMLEVEECRLCQIAIDSYVTAAVPNQIQIVLFIQVPSSAAWWAKYIGYSILVNLLYQKLYYYIAIPAVSEKEQQSEMKEDVLFPRRSGKMKLNVLKEQQSERKEDVLISEGIIIAIAMYSKNR